MLEEMIRQQDDTIRGLFTLPQGHPQRLRPENSVCENRPSSLPVLSRPQNRTESANHSAANISGTGSHRSGNMVRGEVSLRQSPTRTRQMESEDVALSSPGRMADQQDDPMAVTDRQLSVSYANVLSGRNTSANYGHSSATTVAGASRAGSEPEKKQVINNTAQKNRNFAPGGEKGQHRHDNGNAIGAHRSEEAGDGTGKVARRRNKVIVYGTVTEDEVGDFKAYIPKSHIHVSKAGLDVTKEHVVEYVKKRIQRANVDVGCEELTVKSGEYRSFKVSIPANFKQTLLNGDFWPENVAVKLFWDFQKRNPQKRAA